MDTKKILTALALIAFAGLSLAQTSPQNQPLLFQTFEAETNNPIPVMFGTQPAQDGWIVQIICTGDDGEINPPGEGNLPGGDDFLADSIQNNLAYFYLNGDAIWGEPGTFWMFKALNCLPDSGIGCGVEPVINIGDEVYLRAFNSADWTTATQYSTMPEPYIITAINPPLPHEVFGVEFQWYLVGDNWNQGYVVTEYKLHQNYPNPFNPDTYIEYDVLETGKVFLTVYNIKGEEVVRLVNGEMREGGKKYSISWKAEGLSSGIYFYRYQVNDFKDIRKMVLVR
jgi:hypothetical protein